MRFHDHIAGAGKNVLDSACDLKLEGIVSKRLDSTYQSRRTDSWIKTKCQHEQEFVIAGYTRPAGQRTGFGALLLVTIAMRICLLRTSRYWVLRNIAARAQGEAKETRDRQMPVCKSDLRALNCAALRGSSRSWSPRSVLPPAPMTASCGMQSFTACAKINPPHK